MTAYGSNNGETDTFRQLTRVEVKNKENPNGHVIEIIHRIFGPYFGEVMSAGALNKERQNGRIMRLQVCVVQSVKAIGRMRYDQSSLPNILGAYDSGVTKTTQSADSSGNLLTKLKTAISISQSTNKTEETLHAKGRVK